MDSINAHDAHSDSATILDHRVPYTSPQSNDANIALGQTITPNAKRPVGRPKGSTNAARANRAQSGGSDAVPNPTLPATITVPPAARADARELLSAIGKRFAKNRSLGKSDAYSQYQMELSENMSVLVMGGVLTLKELTVLLMDLESFIKGASKEGETPAMKLAQFLRGELEME